MNPRKTHSAFCCLLGAFVFAVFPGCNEPLPEFGEPSGEGDGRQASAEFVLVGSEPVVFEGKGNPKHFELLADPEFKRFAEGPTPEWQQSHRGWKQVAGAPESTSVSTVDGVTVLSVRPDAKGVELRQSIADLGPVAPDEWLIATMRAKADTPYTLGLVFSFTRDGARVEAAEGHPGDGQWHEVRLAMPVPFGLTQNLFDCSIVYVGNPRTAASVDWARVRLEPSGETGPQNLAVNGDFERYRFTRLPYPWALDRWNSEGNPVEGGDALIVAASGLASGAFAISFTPPVSGTNVRISQAVLPIGRQDSGAKLVAKAVGLASHDRELWFQMRCQKNGREVNSTRQFVVHPGDGQWHELLLEFTVPADTVADTVYVDAFRRSFTQTEVMIDNIRVERQ